MGGPPAHELYRDLVMRADLRLYRGKDGEPWVVLKDGERRRAFGVPSPELMGALDRFRMRRNLRPVPERDIDEFSRIIQAHVSDPDAAIPELVPGKSDFEDLTAPEEADSLSLEDPLSPWDESTVSYAPKIPISTTVSGGVKPPEAGAGDDLPKYVRVLRDLVRNGDWLGSLSELSNRLGEDSFTVGATLIRYRTALATSGVMIAPVEVEDGWKWLAVDRGRVRSSPP
jgi:hypothetical protein